MHVSFCVECKYLNIERDPNYKVLNFVCMVRVVFTTLLGGSREGGGAFQAHAPPFGLWVSVVL